MIWECNVIVPICDEAPKANNKKTFLDHYSSMDLTVAKAKEKTLTYFDVVPDIFWISSSAILI